MNHLFTWLDQHDSFYWATGIGSFVLLILWAATGVQTNVRTRRWFSSNLISSLIILASLLAWRWPFLLSATEYNPDESQFLAGSITLTHDPVFWRSVDGTTSGPLNFYILLPIHWIGAPIDYFTARLTALCLVWLALLAIHAALKEKYGEAVARQGILPAVMFFTLVHEWDYIHYSSEHVSLFLFSFSTYLIAKSTARRRYDALYLYGAAFFAGMMPWAKLQAGPIGLALISWGAVACYRSSPPTTRFRRIWLFFFSAGTPTLVFLTQAAAFGEFDTLANNYVVQNIFYVGEGNSLFENLANLRLHAAETHLFPIFLLTELAVVTLGACWSLWQRKLPDFFWIGGAVFSIASTACVLIPGRGFLHYTLFAIIPFSLWATAALDQVFSSLSTSRTRRLFSLLAITAASFPISLRLQQPSPDMIGRLSYDWKRPRSPLGNILRKSAQREDCLAVWGWYARLYVESGLPQATRSGYTYWSIEPSPFQDYHRSIFLRDIMKNRPAFFVDAVGRGSYFFSNRATAAHEIFPGLRDYIQKEYQLLIDFGSSRFYVRRDRLDAAAFSLPALKHLAEAGRSEPQAIELPEEPPIDNSLPRKVIDDRNVIMVLPPAQLTWPLDGTEQEFMFEYGYDPNAYREPSQGNGTELAVVLVRPGRDPEMLFKRLIDPAHVPSDRGRQNAQIALPDLPPGSIISVKTEPGPYNDNSWDWAYVTNGRFRRYPFYFQPSINKPDRPDSTPNKRGDDTVPRVPTK